jgi:hypothetical protein
MMLHPTQELEPPANPERFNAEVAQKVGYGFASVFGLVFVRHEGLSPGAFANKCGG